MVDERKESSKDDPLDELDLEDVDLDALLDEVDQAPAEETAPEASHTDDAPTDLLSEEVSEEDLLSDDELVEVESSGASDDPVGSDELSDEDLDALLMDAENDAGSASGGTELFEEPAASGSDWDHAGESPASNGDGDVDGEASSEDADIEALLAGDLEEDAAPEAPVQAEDSGEEEAKGKGKGKKKGFAKSGAGKKSFSPKGKKSGKEPRAPKPAKERESARELKKAPKKPAGKVLTFVCSECYAEISVSATYSDDKVTCPDCLHVGKKPDESFLRTVSSHKASEKKSFALTALVGALMAVTFLSLVYLRSAYAAPELASEDLRTWTYALLGGGGLLTIIFLVLLWRSEGNRWEVYF